MNLSKATNKELHQHLLARFDELKRIREPWLKRWRDVSNYISPFSGKFSVSDHSQSRNYDYILDNEGSRALNILTSGLASGATSPVRQWFKINTGDINNNLALDVANWCSDVEHLLLKVFQASNTYNSLHMVYRELALFGVAVDLIYDDVNNVIRHHVLTAGEYCLGTNAYGIVDSLYREFQLTAVQAVKFFGYDNVSKEIKRCYDRGQLEEYFTFGHAIEPREDRNYSSKSNRDMPYASYYFELEGQPNTILKESGFNYFPALCPRWEVLGSDPYGLSPSMTALPNIKQLQQETEVKAILLENLANPPLQAPSMSRQDPISLVAGSINYTQTTGNDFQIKPIVQGVGDINSITQDILQLKAGIKSDFFVDLFLLVQTAQTDRKTATEIYALKEEKMLVLGSVMERLQHELLAPLVSITFEKLLELDAIPIPPQALQGSGVEIEFQSMLAQSQRAVDINAIDRMISSTFAVSASIPDVLDRLNPDGLIDVYRDRLAVDPKIFRSKEEADQIRQQRAQMQQAQMQAEQLQTLGAGANQLAQAQKMGVDASLATQQLDPIGGALG